MNGTWKLTGKGGRGQCGHCPRKLAVTYTVTSTATGKSMTVGRGCLKKITGWTLTAAQAAAILRRAERDARWDAWCTANPAEAAIITAGADREAEEVRQRRRQVAGPAQEVKHAIAGGEFGWKNFLAEYLNRHAARQS